MGRKPTKNLNLPQGMRARKQKSGTIYYYYDHGGRPRKETPLGSDYVEAVRKWAVLEKADKPAGAIITFYHVAERYKREVIPSKAERTQRDNLDELAQLYRFFNDPPVLLDEIEPIHVRQYLDWSKAQARTRAEDRNAERVKAGRTPKPVTGQEGNVRANREKALFSHIWNKAREWGYTSAPNPCAGVRGHKEHPRDVYVDETAYRAVWQEGDQALKDALDLAWLTGQRPGDVLKMTEGDIKDGALWVKQSKTGAKLRIAVEGELSKLLHRIEARKKQHKVRTLRLLVDMNGHPLTATALRSKFDNARDKSGQSWQYRDLRAKAGTEKEMAGGIAAAQDQLGHASATMTATYVRHRAGKLVKPTK